MREITVMTKPSTNLEESLKNKKVVVFDLDGTLTESKSEIDWEMAGLLEKLLEKKKVAVIGGGKYELFQRQLLSELNISGELLKNLFLFPTTATAFYRHNGTKWEEVYKDNFSKKERDKIFSAFKKSFQDLNYKHPEKICGELIEDRGGQMVFSALGQDAPLEAKERWNRENPDVRLGIKNTLQKYIPEMKIKIGGLTSIDVTRKGIDKAYGMRQIEKHLGIAIEDMLFIGDAFSHEGNDEAALQTGVSSFEVKSVEDTKNLIRYLIS